MLNVKQYINEARCNLLFVYLKFEQSSGEICLQL